MGRRVGKTTINTRIQQRTYNADHYLFALLPVFAVGCVPLRTSRLRSVATQQNEQTWSPWVGCVHATHRLCR